MRRRSDFLAHPFQPRLEHLEYRLPPGDAVAGALLAMRWAGWGESARETISKGEGSGWRGAAPVEDNFSIPVSPRSGNESSPGHAVHTARTASTAELPPWEMPAGSGSHRPRFHPFTPESRPQPGFADNLSPGVAADLRPGFSFAPAVPYTTDSALAQLVLGLPGGSVQSAGVRALFDLSTPETGPFPSNRFTVADATQNTGRRVDLPLPDCTQRPSDCNDLDVLNTLDGFNLQPRLTVPFDGPIDPASVTSDSVFLVSLGSTRPFEVDPRGTVVGINQIIWDPATSTLAAESDNLLAQHTRYALVVTGGVIDEFGDSVEAAPEFRNFRDLQGELESYRDELVDAMTLLGELGVPEESIVTASVFTTQSTTSTLERVRDQLLANPPKPADFLLGSGGERTVFDLADVTGINWQQQTRTNPPGFNDINLPLQHLHVVPGAIGRLAYGKFVSPEYRTADRIIPQIGTLTGTPEVQGYSEIFFNLFLPRGKQPTNGWPVAIFGHGTPSDKNVVPLQTAAKVAEQGVAVLALNAVGHGFGPLGTLTVTTTSSTRVTFPAGGRGVDVDGDRYIDGSEGVSASGVYSLVGDRDGKRQTVVDLMRVVRTIEVGMDVNGDGRPDLDPQRVSYFGRSYGGIYGTVFLGIEPHVAAGVLIVGGGSQIESRRLSAVNRPVVGRLLATRTPSLLNSPGLSHIGGLPVGPPYFNENKPLRDRPPLGNPVAGAMAIQQFFDRHEWAGLPGDPLAYAPHLRKAPLPGTPEKSVILQFGKGDQNVPNPATTAVLRAGGLADRATYYRHDLAFAEDQRRPRNAHGFQIDITDPTMRDIALGAQEQIGVFFASNGNTVIHPEPARFFEVPIRGPLPEEMNYLV